MSKYSLIGAMSGENGTVIVNDTSEFTQPFTRLVALEDTVIATLETDSVSVLSDHITTPATGLKAMGIIAKKRGKVFDKLTLTSGSVMVVLA